MVPTITRSASISENYAYCDLTISDLLNRNDLPKFAISCFSIDLNRRLQADEQNQSLVELFAALSDPKLSARAQQIFDQLGEFISTKDLILHSLPLNPVDLLNIVTQEVYSPVETVRKRAQLACSKLIDQNDPKAIIQASEIALKLFEEDNPVLRRESLAYVEMLIANPKQFFTPMQCLQFLDYAFHLFFEPDTNQMGHDFIVRVIESSLPEAQGVIGRQLMQGADSANLYISLQSIKLLNLLFTRFPSTLGFYITALSKTLSKQATLVYLLMAQDLIHPNPTQLPENCKKKILENWVLNAPRWLQVLGPIIELQEPFVSEKASWLYRIVDRNLSAKQNLPGG